MNATIASAEDGADDIEIQAYTINMVMGRNRKIQVNEKITVRFLSRGLTMFYRSLPTDGTRYSGIVATCEGNDEFSYYVADNPDYSGFIDVNCTGNADYGKTWTYDISYTMEQSVNAWEKGMAIDVVGFGWRVPLHDVTVTVQFPAAPQTYGVYTDVFGVESGNEVTENWSDDKKTLTLYSQCLDMTPSGYYEETVAGGITLELTFAEGVLDSYARTRIFTGDMWKILVGCGVALLLSILLLLLTKKKREIITVVHVAPPDGMDPLKMGKWIDGSADNADVTSMIYYFANQGYLKIDFSDESDPELIALVSELPENAPNYQKTLFNGLFQYARAYSEKPFEEADTKIVRATKISEVGEKFFEASQKAIRQVPRASSRYERKSIFGYLSGAIIGFLLAFIVPMCMSFRLGGGYVYFLEVTFIFPLGVIAIIGVIRSDYRHKWKKSGVLAAWLVQIAVAVLFSLLFIFGFAEFIMTEYEKLALCVGTFSACFLTQGALSYTEKYLKTLGDILGFKEFIVVTEEDKIKFMLEENPELYYKILPYAQVLGVTKEWEDKFEKLMIEPPSWYVGPRMTVFDYYLLDRCLTRSMVSAMTRAAAAAANKTVGRSGGGGSFGGFGGGGFGGGGGGAR